MTALAFSPDGSMLAAACSGTITLWDVASNSLVGTLASPRALQQAPFSHLAFLHHSPHLVAAAGGPSPLLACWSLLTGVPSEATAVRNADADKYICCSQLGSSDTCRQILVAGCLHQSHRWTLDTRLDATKLVPVPTCCHAL